VQSYDTLLEYRLWRKTGSDPPVLLADLTPQDTTYDDNIRDLQYQPGNKGIYCYRIEAVGKSSPPGRESHSFSPLICIAPEAKVFFPNAFTPNGDNINDLFSPVFSFAPEDYHLIIRNRWGTILFESNDYLKKWDGKDLKGHPVTAGSYVYYLTARTPDGREIKKTGQVLIIYPR
jgi:gliding motility-associated-like protein